jgi:2-polyprenyl-3-methyl-5-hydroxy-6-metoxy-1,4-benzoquinol methylase
MLGKIKRIIKEKTTSSINKDNEFDPNVYNDEQYCHRDHNVYDRYGKVVLDLFKPVDYMDIGCANGFVADFLLSKGVDANGIEGADAAFNHMPETIKPKVHQLDLREDWTEYFYSNIKRKFEVVNFTEVAEHLKPEHEDMMINNVKMLVGKFLIMSWSNEWCPFKGTDKQEHFNPRDKKYVIQKMKKYGFDFQESMSIEFNKEIENLEVYEHWKNTILVFKV